MILNNFDLYALCRLGFWQTLLHYIHFVITIPSVSHLSVMFVHPTEKVELFSNIFAPCNSLRARAGCVKILEIDCKNLPRRC